MFGKHWNCLTCLTSLLIFPLDVVLAVLAGGDLQIALRMPQRHVLVWTIWLPPFVFQTRQPQEHRCGALSQSKKEKASGKLEQYSAKQRAKDS